MKRQVSISIFLAILVIALAWLYIKSSNDTQPEENGVLTEENIEETKQALPISQTCSSYQFYLKDDDGRVAIYDVKTQEIYAQTGIETNTLPSEMRQKLSTGIYFETERELYNFLESYSS